MNAQTGRAPDPHEISFGLRIFITAVLLYLVNQLTGVPAPGISAGVLNFGMLDGGAGDAGLSGLAASRVSIVALQFTPVYSALVLFEVFKLALPGMANWDSPDPGTRRRINRGLLILAFLLALWQGWGVAGALEGLNAAGTPIVEEPGSAFRASFMLTQVAGTAVLVAIADCITRYGIGSGFWVLIAAFELATLPLSLAVIGEAHARGMLDQLVIVALAGAVAGGAAAAIALYRAGLAGGQSPQEAAGDVILPPFLGLALGSLFYGLALLPAIFGQGDWTAGSGNNALWLATGIAGIFIVALLRVSGRPRALRVATSSSILFVALEIVGQHGAQAVRADILIIAAIVCALAYDYWAARQPVLPGDTP